MSKTWIIAKRPEFTRDLLRDYCLMVKELTFRFNEYDRNGHVDFDALRNLLGEEMNKGLVWRLKDTAHHLFRNAPKGPYLGRFLDWGLGYIFHECLKLKEDAYQQQYYAPWFKDLQHRSSSDEQPFAKELAQVVDQTRESIQREITRVRFIMAMCREMLPTYFAEFPENEHVARFIFMQNELVRETFGPAYDTLINKVYDGHPERMLLLAARSLRCGGWLDEAGKAALQAGRLAPDDPQVQAELAHQDSGGNARNAV